MSAEPFRKAALDRLSSPEQVDDLLSINSAKYWIALLAIFLVLVTVVIWSIKGSLASKASGQAVILRSGTILNAVSLGGGVVLSVNVKVGDRVAPGQVIARVGEPTLIAQIKAAEVELNQAKYDRTAAIEIAKNNAKLQLTALQVQRLNTTREISDFDLQARLADEKIAVDQELYSSGLATKWQVLDAKQTRVTVEQNIADRKALLKSFDSQEYSLNAEPQLENAKLQQQIQHQELVLRGLQEQLSLSQDVRTTYGGQVIEMKADPGMVIEANTPILSIEPDSKNLEVLVCVPYETAKSIRPGMEAEISPSTIKREEFGFIRGTVTYAANFPATPAALMREFENEDLVKAITRAGPVSQVRINMDRDKDAISGLQWSSSKGPPLAISSGTICSVDVITRKQRPISLLVPYLKKTLGLY